MAAWNGTDRYNIDIIDIIGIIDIIDIITIAYRYIYEIQIPLSIGNSRKDLKKK